MTIRENKNSLINNVMNLSDMENLIVATFIAGMQAKKDTVICQNIDTEQPCKLSTTQYTQSNR